MEEKRKVEEGEKRLAKDWLARIDKAKERFQKEFKQFQKNRLLLRGVDPKDTNKKVLANLHFANLATMLPQVYAKDPEYSVRPTKAVPEAKLKAIEGFCRTAEIVLTECLVKRAKLKKRAKRMVRSAYTTSIGWWKLCYQEDKKNDPVIQNQIKDLQDNLMRLEADRAKLNEPGVDNDLQIEKIKQDLAGLQAQPASEVVVSRGITLDFVMPEDVLVIDASVREFCDYERSGALAHRVWMTRDQYRAKFGYSVEKGKGYVEKDGQIEAGSSDKKDELLCVWEVWDQDTSRIYHVCEGEEGFCREPFSPDWTGQRWLSFFGLAFNEIDGTFYPLSDVELTDQLVREYNETRTDFRRDRKYALPLNLIRKGGSFTDEDVKRVSNREGGDTIVVEGVAGHPISNDVWSGALATIQPENYNTQPARADMEMIVGGGDAARGSVLEAKTATEAEILSQGLRGRSAERQDTMEDMLSEAGAYALQILLRKMPIDEIKKIAGEGAVWPELDVEQIFDMVTVDVRGGSTGKPDRLQEQDRWTKLMPVIQDAMVKVGELRAQGMEDQAQAIIALTKETVRRFDERVDIEQFLPTPKEGEEKAPADPMQDPRVMQMLQEGKQMLDEQTQQIQQLEQQLKDKEIQHLADVEKARINADKEIKVAQVTAPIEADAKVEAARITAEANARAKAEVDSQRLEQQRIESERKSQEDAIRQADKDRQDQERQARDEERRVQQDERRQSEAQQTSQVGSVVQQSMQALMEQIQANQQQIAQLAQSVQQMANKPRMKVVHVRDPNTNRIIESKTVPEDA